MTSENPHPARRLPYLLRVIRARPRTAISVAVGIVVMALLPSDRPMATRFLISWDAGVALYLLLVFGMMTRAGIDHMRRNAALQDEGRFAILILTVIAAGASLGAILSELSTAQGATRTGMQLALATITIVLSWTFVHTIFALHYAHEYYGERGAKHDGLNFPGEGKPDYWDFAYFSFVIGMTSQVSDVAIASKPIRRTAIAHGIFSFFFNVTLVALMVNIAASAI
jgi:uncharacterized membrane protein